MALGSNNPRVVVSVEGDASQYKSTIDDAVQKTSNIGQQFKQIGSNLSQIGRSMTAYFTVPIVGAMAVVGKEFTDLDEKMRNIQSITGMSEDSLGSLQERLINLSKDQTKTVESAASLADAYYFVKSAVDDSELAFEALEVSTMAATAGLTDTKTAANAIVGAYYAYENQINKVTGKQYTFQEISDILFKTVDRGVITFDELADGLGRLTNTAAIAGIPLQDVGAAMVVLTRQGMPAAEAFTALNQVMSKLASPTQKILDAAEELGVDISIAAVKTKGLAGVLDDIYKADPTGEGFFKLFGNNVRALKGSAALAGSGIKDLKEEMQRMNEATGRTAEAFGEQTKSLSSMLAFLKNDLMAVGLTLMTTLLPYIKQFIEWLSKGVDWLSKLNPTTQKWVLALLALLAVIGPLLMILGSLVTGIGAVITIVGAITAPIWIAIGVILALIATAVLLYLAWKNNWWGVRDITDKVLAWIKAQINAFHTWWNQLTTGQLGVLSTLWKNTWDSITTIFNTAVANLKLLWQAFQYARQGDWYNFGATLRQIWDNNWNAMVTVLRNTWSNISAVLSTSVSNIKNWWNNINWKSLGTDIANGIINGLNNMGSALYNKMKQIAKNMLYAFQGVFGINSPSKVMEQQFDYLAQGANLGWNNNFQFSPQAISSQMYSSISMPQSFSSEGNGKIVSLLEQLNGKDQRLDEGVLVRAFRDAVLLMRD